MKKVFVAIAVLLLAASSLCAVTLPKDDAPNAMFSLQDGTIIPF